jgi:formate dehydrogenase subunit gamma
MLRSDLVRVITTSLLISCFAGFSFAQQTPAPAAVTPKAPTVSGVQSANIFEVKPDASLDANYAAQSNGERAKVQPGNNAPMWRQVGSGTEGYSSLPKDSAPEAGVLIQPFTQYPGSRLTTAGEAWRQVRNNWIIPYGGALLLIVLGAIGLFYWRRGAIKLNESPTGRKIERFTPFERSAHLANAIAFVVLAVSGLVLAFGQYLLMPLMGSTLFGYFAYVLKNAHNFAGPLFAVSLVVMIFTYVRDNFPAKEDLTWLLKGGGLLSKQHVKAGRFNAGEKLLFWLGVFSLGLIVVASGLVMNKLVPGLSYERGMMQIAHMVHAVATIAMMVLFMGHIYLGTIGTEGTLEGMRTGYVDESWAKEHHALWLEDIKAGKISASRTADKNAARLSAAEVVKA